MKAAVIVVDNVYLPGIHSDLMVARDQAEALDRLWKREGFGCLEVVLASPQNPNVEPGPANLKPLGALVELVVDQASLLSNADEVRLEISDGHRVELEQPEAVSQVYGSHFPAS